MNNNIIVLKWRNRRFTAKVRDICWIESYNRHLSVHTAARTFEVVGKLSEIMGALGDDFICVHKSFVVNMNCIAGIDENGITTSGGDVLPVSVRKRKQVIEAFDRFCEKRNN